MNANTALIPALHLVSARGGGSVRFACDLVALAPGSGLLHVDEQTAVLEIPGDPIRFRPYAIATGHDAAAWLQALIQQLGAPLLHVHFMHPTTLALLESWSALDQPWLLSVHDLGFLSPHAFESSRIEPDPDPQWINRWRVLMSTVAAVTLPSPYLMEVFARQFPQQHTQLVAPGVELPEPSAHLPTSLRKIAVIGGLGPHKGKERLFRWLQSDAGQRYSWVLIGYTDDQLYPERCAHDRLWVHGPFLHQQTAHWLEHYAVDLVVFPNQMAESFSYALSDVWAAGVPALVPDAGALGQRMRQHGAGGLLANPDDVQALNLDLNALEDAVQLHEWRQLLLHQRTDMVPTLAMMERSMTQVHQAMTIDAGSKPLPMALVDLQPYLRTQLDELVFRKENIRLARDYGQVREWADKLKSDVSTMESTLADLGQARSEIEAVLANREIDIAALQARNREVEADATSVRERNARVEADAAELVARAHEIEIQLQLQSARTQALEQDLIHWRTQAELEVQRQQAQAQTISELQQRLHELGMQMHVLQIKATRYDRVRAWVPEWIISAARWLRAGIRGRSGS